MPHYLLIERNSQSISLPQDITTSSLVITTAAKPPEATLDGYTYSGAYFKPQEWASLKRRFDQELQDYSTACHLRRTHRLPPDARSPHHNKAASPPCDLASLKSFVRMGRQHWKQRRDNAKWKQIQRQVQRTAKIVHQYQKQQKAPKRVILYLEGLDCAGKSSTGLLIVQTLKECGFGVTVAQHNRPPTAEQQNHPWMDRIRFEYPDDMYTSNEVVPSNAAVVWDRGPAGDFVYGGFDQLSDEDKLKKYEEFRSYDIHCREEGVMFLKFFFVADKDSIAATLGKRLAHKQIVRDLRVWLDANSVEHTREDLDAIVAHIDPTDFVAFNKYNNNIMLFSDFARYVGTCQKRDNCFCFLCDSFHSLSSRNTSTGGADEDAINPVCVLLCLTYRLRCERKLSVLTIFTVPLSVTLII
jgi:polyphosphate kinase 2 (PPK2 family)